MRIGGDEFLCGLPDLPHSDAIERFAHIDQDLTTTRRASITTGFADLTESDTLSSLLKRADAAMYQTRIERQDAHG